MFKNFRIKNASDIYIEFGSSEFKIFAPSINYKKNVPSIIYVDSGFSEIKAIGDNAMGYVSTNKFKSVKPFESGTITDYKASEMFLKYFLEDVVSLMDFKSKFLRPNISVSIHSSFTEVELSAFTDAISSVGVSDVRYFNEGVASYYSLENPNASGLICKIGYSYTDIIVLVNNEIAEDATIRFGIRNIVSAIRNHLKSKYSLLVGQNKLLDILKEIDISKKRNSEIKIKGKGVSDGLPVEIKIDDSEIKNIVVNEFEIVADTLKKLFEKLNSEVVSLIDDSGIVISGGGSLISGIDKLISEKTKMTISSNSDIFSSAVGLQHINSSPELRENFQIKDFILL